MAEAPRDFCIIVAGGTGTRLWPWSRQSHPKQFLKLFEDQTFLESVYQRAKLLVPAENIFLVAPESYSEFLTKFLPDFPLNNFMGEPEKKGTTAAYGYAATYIKTIDPNAIVHIIAADDHIVDNDRYQKSFSLARQIVATNNALVIFGVKPKDPNTGYGYVKVDLNSKIGMEPIIAYKVTGFHEKPPLETAKSYLTDPSYFWHTFGFSVTVGKLLSLIKTHDPETSAVLDQIEADLHLPARLEAGKLREHYGKIKESNIEEKILTSEANQSYMVVLEETWSDVGTWDHIYNLGEKDAAGNVVLSNPAKIYSLDVKNSLIAGTQKSLALIGLNNLIIVQTDDVTLIADKNRSQDVKKIVDLLKERKINDLL